jgi:hypothetical protein
MHFEPRIVSFCPPCLKTVPLLQSLLAENDLFAFPRAPESLLPRKALSTSIYGRGSDQCLRRPANPYLDLEAVESGDSGEEENLDKYETDFIDDGDDVDPDDG